MEIPFLFIFLVITTFSSSKGKVFSRLSKNKETLAMSAGGLVFDPWKIISNILSALNVLAEVLPKTNTIASKKFDFPDPFGPQIREKLLGNVTIVFFGKDLNPCISSFSILIIQSLVSLTINY